MKNIFLIVFSLLCSNIFSQKDSLEIGDKYLEDQLYINLTYNVLYKQPNGISSSKFSYGISAGYIKDIPITANGKFAFGIGFGYGFDSFNHGVKVSEVDSNDFFESVPDNKLRLHNLELPLQFRIRSSEVNKYSFWRIYAGVKITYNLNNKFSYVTSGNSIAFNNIESFNRWQTGLTLSAGYGTFNFYAYYGLSPIFKKATINSVALTTKMFKLGLSFYLL
ncbi:porin family protein [Tenacibaculum sp. nBUS_03]|uniref:porin family protein n=1 Tax=Tenacibaculum sp. nBUS_03 TaxID=3395320 RepID=UPI003EBADCF6